MLCQVHQYRPCTQALIFALTWISRLLYSMRDDNIWICSRFPPMIGGQSIRGIVKWPHFGQLKTEPAWFAARPTVDPWLLITKVVFCRKLTISLLLIMP